MTPRKPKDEEVQKVRIEEVGQEAKDAHQKVVSASVFSEKVMLAFFGAIVAASTLGQMYLQYQTGRSVEAGNEANKKNAVAQASSDAEVAAKAEQAAKKVEVVKQTLDSTTQQTAVKLNNLEKVTKETHLLVNSGSLVTLKLLAEVSRWKADQTKDPDHIKAAELAEQNVREHEAKQAELDANRKEE